MFVKVPVVALMVMAAFAVVCAVIGFTVSWVNATFGEDVTITVVLVTIIFAIVCLFTWIALED